MPATPPADHTLAWASPDDILADTASLTRSTPLSFTMTGTGSDISSPSDFAFEPRAIPSDSPFEPYKADKTANYPPYTPNSYTNPAYNVPQYGYSSASPFSSTSGSATGSSFSSADALPAISRNFVRPSPTETRRPATAGGALQSRSPFVGYMGGDGTRFRRLNQRSAAVTAEDGKAQRFTETIDEAGEGVFANPNPFASPSEEDNDKQVPLQNVVDPRFIPGHRRASEPHFATINQQPSWSQAYTASPISQFPLNPMSAQASQYNSAMNMQHHIQQLQRAIPNLSSRPQTSDGLPSYSGVVSLPSARTIVNQIDGFTPQTHFVQRQDDKTMQPASLMPFRDARAASVGTSPLSQSNLSRAYSIDSSKTARPSHVSRSSARNGETDSQGEMTFVPLGGPAPKKRPRRRFDEIERLYTCGWDGCEKAYGTLNHLNAHVAMQKHGEKRLPSEFKDMRKAWRKMKREQTASFSNGQYINGTTSAWPQRPSIDSSSSGSESDHRDSTMSMLSTSDRGSVAYATLYGYGDSRPTTSSSIASSADGRSCFPSQYSHHMLNAVPAAVRRPSAPGHLPMPEQVPQGFRPAEGDHPTPTQQNPFPSATRQSYPFQTLTSPMPMPMPAGGQQFGAQFAFQQ